MNLSEFIAHLETKTGHKPRANGQGCLSLCPAHADKNPSLSVSEGKKGRILLNCHAGCSFEAVVSALGLLASDLAPPTQSKSPALGRASSSIVAEYNYRDEGGKLLFQVCRMEPKSFRQRRPNPSGPNHWVWNLKGVRQVPYRLPELLTAIRAGSRVFVAEGEKDVESLARVGLAATCNAGGAGKWHEEFGKFFQGADSVIVIADKDQPGRAHAAAVAAKLKPVCRSVKLIELPDCQPHTVKDAADFFAAGGTAEALCSIASEAPEYVPKSELTPSAWFKARFPRLREKHGEPVHETITGHQVRVRDISEDFMAATLGWEGNSKAPAIYLPFEERFYSYNPESGIFERQREEDIARRLSALFLECVRGCGESADTTKLEFGLRDSAALAGIVKRAKAILAMQEDFFSASNGDFVPVANGMLRLQDRALLPFAPTYRCRHKLAVSFDPGARCPNFENKLLLAALDRSDVSLVQRWAGLALLGANRSQKMLLLTGTAGGGKSTLVSVLTGVIGARNVGTLRTELLNDRFELGRLLDKTLLYGADVSENFLTQETASRLKSLTGGDMLTVEFKNSNEAPQLRCQFNVIVTSNSRLTVYLEGDVEAWRRRLLIVNYQRPKPLQVIHDLADRILAEEGAGVLNFMLDGLESLRADEWQFRLDDRQKRRVDDLLLESDSHRVFVQECLVKDTAAPGMTKSDVYAAFVEFCDGRGWAAMNKNRFGRLGAEAITQTFGLVPRGDIQNGCGKQNDGWKSLRLRTENDGED